MNEFRKISTLIAEDYFKMLWIGIFNMENSTAQLAIVSNSYTIKNVYVRLNAISKFSRRS